jgi:hypothetical protein
MVMPIRWPMAHATVDSQVAGNVLVVVVSGVMTLDEHKLFVPGVHAEGLRVGSTDAIVVDFRQCSLEFDPMDSVTAVGEAFDRLPHAQQPVALLVARPDLKRFTAFAAKMGSFRAVRRAFTDRQEALDWASKKGRIWRATLKRKGSV